MPRGALGSYVKAIRDLSPGVPASQLPLGWRLRAAGLLAFWASSPACSLLRVCSQPVLFFMHPPAGVEVAVDVISEHTGSTRLGSQSLINTRVTGVPKEKLTAIFRAMVCCLQACKLRALLRRNVCSC